MRILRIVPSSLSIRVVGIHARRILDRAVVQALRKRWLVFERGIEDTLWTKCLWLYSIHLTQNLKFGWCDPRMSRLQMVPTLLTRSTGESWRGGTYASLRHCQSAISALTLNGLNGITEMIECSRQVTRSWATSLRPTSRLITLWTILNVIICWATYTTSPWHPQNRNTLYELGL